MYCLSFRKKHLTLLTSKNKKTIAYIHYKDIYPSLLSLTCNKYFFSDELM